jgi:hypothetical protein
MQQGAHAADRLDDAGKLIAHAAGVAAVASAIAIAITVAVSASASMSALAAMWRIEHRARATAQQWMPAPAIRGARSSAVIYACSHD